MTDQCPYCHASLKKYWHSITPGLVKTLIKCYVYASEHDNEFKMRDLNLDHSEYGNFQKLRFHALIAKRKQDGERVERVWLITGRGADFLKGVMTIPDRVQTFRNRVVEHSPIMVNVRDVMRSEPYWEEKFDFNLFEPKQLSII